MQFSEEKPKHYDLLAITICFRPAGADAGDAGPRQQGIVHNVKHPAGA
jgi:hypothetical protein